jgi:hypothetical protein
MIGHEIDVTTGEELVRLVRALGKHRYVASRLHLLHAFAVEAAAVATADPALDDAAAWAARVTGSGGAIDLTSKDERLLRNATDAELSAVLDAFWAAGERCAVARKRLRERLSSIGVDVDDEAARTPFDETREDDVFPVLADAGWELTPLAGLDRERHKGAIASFGDDLAFDIARFDEESAVPAVIPLHELPLLGATELLGAFDEDGAARAPFVLWETGNPTYLDYVLRGVRRAARLALD